MLEPNHQDVVVVIPVYNRVELLRRCLLSLAQQTFKDFTTVVVDDESTEDIKSVVNEFLQILSIMYIKSPHFGGPARPRNLGISNSSAKFIAFLDSDDYWHPNKLEISIRMMKLSHMDVLYHDLQKSNSIHLMNSNSGLLHSADLSCDPLKVLLLEGNCIPNSSAVVRRKALLKVLPIDEDMKLISVEDYDLWIRLALSGARFCRLQKVLGYYEEDQGISSSRHKQRRVTAYQALFEKYTYLCEQQSLCYPAYIAFQYAISLLSTNNVRKVFGLQFALLTQAPIQLSVIKLHIKLLQNLIRHSFLVYVQALQKGFHNYS